MNKINFKTILQILIVLVFIVILVSVLGGNNHFNKKSKDLAILKKIFPASTMTPTDKLGFYQIEGADKISYNVLDNSPVIKKLVTIRYIEIGSNLDKQKETVAILPVTFLGDVCVACRTKLYLVALKINKSDVSIIKEQDFNSENSDLFLSDLTLQDAQVVDINNDSQKEFQIVFKADEYFGLDKVKVAIFQWNNNQFNTLWQQVVHFNMDNDTRLPENEKQNFDATFKFTQSDSRYKDILVEKTISKDKGVNLNPPDKLLDTYKFTSDEYKIWKEEKITQ